MSESADAIPQKEPVSEAPALQRAGGSPAAWVRLLLPAVVGVAADLWVKNWTFPDGVTAEAAAGHELAGRFPAPFSSQTLIPKVLDLTTTVNPGAVFGLGKGWLPYFLVFSVLALGLIVWVFATSRRSHWVVHIALGLILAGALGNMYDRAVFHGVRDMFRFRVWWYPWIFNVADALLCVGVPVLMLRWLFMGEPRKAVEEQSD